jgi:hypothetical protein
MAEQGVVDGSACDLAAVGTPDLSLIPPGVPYTISSVDGYTCVNW